MIDAFRAALLTLTITLPVAVGMATPAEAGHRRPMHHEHFVHCTLYRLGPAHGHRYGRVHLHRSTHDHRRKHLRAHKRAHRHAWRRGHRGHRDC